MKILFIDDSYHKEKKYFGYGGFCIDESNVRPLTNDIAKLKHRYKIPLNVEIKWSPDPKHYLRQQFKGTRQVLYNDAISLLRKYSVTVLAAVTDLKECYGVKNFNWDIRRAILWAAKQQFKFLSERFEAPFLEDAQDNGIVIADHFNERKGDKAIVKEIDLAMAFGTEFVNFEKICIVPMMTMSEYCPPIQLADLLIGVIVASLVNSKWGLELFDDIAWFFLKNPHKNSLAFAEAYSSSVIGFGLKLFPTCFSAQGRGLFRKIDDKYIHTHEGVKEKKI